MMETRRISLPCLCPPTSSPSGIAGSWCSPPRTTRLPRRRSRAATTIAASRRRRGSTKQTARSCRRQASTHGSRYVSGWRQTGCIASREGTGWTSMACASRRSTAVHPRSGAGSWSPPQPARASQCFAVPSPRSGWSGPTARRAQTGPSTRCRWARVSASAWRPRTTTRRGCSAFSTAQIPACRRQGPSGGRRGAVPTPRWLSRATPSAETSTSRRGWSTRASTTPCASRPQTTRSSALRSAQTLAWCPTGPGTGLGSLSPRRRSRCASR
mmetsp:Transcript_802/g.1695  ORF Transcript_802/g.1695 Transcript_802/m.1695 type:complete len:270 (+) Transcript_802:1321-2130(+)